MSKSIISVENLGKKYSIGEKQNFYTLRDTVAGIFSGKKKNEEEFWALKDVNFEIKDGESVGIIGRNGAGKSTLLKILSQITPPTTGKITMRGRVASLLEVGTGFHQELTGRENIFLNGAILGMTREEVRRKFDEIVAFSEVEKFLDMPVKHYSSGMYMRLAFAVAAHLESEILIVDEVLAVGDAQFQKKCLGKMDEVAKKQGRTVLFVSHNMSAISQLCNIGILLDHGMIKYKSSDIKRVTGSYLDYGRSIKSSWRKDSKQSHGICDILSVDLVYKNNGLTTGSFNNSDEVYLRVKIQINNYDPALNIGYYVYDEEGKQIYLSCHTDLDEKDWPKLNNGEMVLKTKLLNGILNEGEYFIEVIASLHMRQWILEPFKSPVRVSFKVVGPLSDSPFWSLKRPGVIAPKIIWESTGI